MLYWSRIIAYASRSLTSSEKNYSVIQRECLAAVYGTKQFRHYLLGRHFQLITDHAPLQWLSAQKMEGLLARWALAMQEYDFDIKYRKGTKNANADTLSRCPTTPVTTGAVSVSTEPWKEELRQQQLQDPILSQLKEALQHSADTRLRQWRQPPLCRYHQLWSQLSIEGDIVCRTYRPGPTEEAVTVPIIPTSLQESFLSWVHNSLDSGHLGTGKTIARARTRGYWVNLVQDVTQYCLNCAQCQAAKLPLPTKSPLEPIPIGQPWQMVAVDVLEVPSSYQQNRYLLVIQDYFTKWADAIPMPDQIAERISKHLVKVFSTFGMPQILHSDQGRNFESTIMQKILNAFGIAKSHTTAYHPEGDGMVERFNRTLLQMFWTYLKDRADLEALLPLLLFAYRTAVHSTTGVSPFEMMFGRSPHIADFPSVTAFDAGSYPHKLQAHLAEL